MDDLLNIFESEKLVNISNYSGVYDHEASYKKFDFVYNTGDGMFYYARKDMSVAGQVDAAYSNRFTLDNEGPIQDGSQTYYIYDNLNSSEGEEFFEGQNILINGSLEGSDGSYQIISVQKNIPINIILPAEYNLISILDASSIGEEEYESSWFFKLNNSEGHEAGNYSFIKSTENWIYHDFWGWVYVYLEGNNKEQFFFHALDVGGVWLWASRAMISPLNTSQNSFVYLTQTENSKIGPRGWTEWLGLEDYRMNTDVSYYPYDLDGYSRAIVYLGERLDANIVTTDWNNGELEIDESTYTSLPESTYFRTRGDIKWVVLGQNAFLENHKAIIKNHANGLFYSMRFDKNLNKNVFEQISDPGMPFADQEPSEEVPAENYNLNKTKIQIKSNDSNSSIKAYEPYGDHEIVLSTFKEDINANIDSWSKDLFFFDADYGSTVSFKTNNHKYEFGNGYSTIQPKTVNSLIFEANLKFKNRTNREANAIIHFLENHQGQNKRDSSSYHLEYSQGISGFRWDGASTFHPYDNLEVQTKKFYCREFSHSMNFENSNDINIKLQNLDTSIINKISGLFVNSPNEYSASQYYEKNDIAYSPLNHKNYYWSGDNADVNKEPVQTLEEWSRDGGYFLDQNTDLWTREFFWKPSLGLNINHKPKLNEVGSRHGYVQFYYNGVNQNLLNLNLNFNNRDDQEAWAILHFLEQHLGYLAFEFTPPAPYDKKSNFICQEWTHTYNYKNNHSIQAKFEQIPFNLEAQRYDSSSSAPFTRTDGRLSIADSFVMLSEDNILDIEESFSFRSRLKLTNLGDDPVELYSAYFSKKIVGLVDSDFDVIEDDDPVIIGNGTKFSSELDGVSKVFINNKVYEILEIVDDETMFISGDITESFSGQEILALFESVDGFSIGGQENNDVPAIGKVFESNKYLVDIPQDIDEDLLIGGIQLKGKQIKISKVFTDGIEGGQGFSLTEAGGGKFIQYNNGKIINTNNPEQFIYSKYFLNDEFIKNNKSSFVNSAEIKYLEICFDSSYLYETDYFLQFIEQSSLDAYNIEITNENLSSGRIIIDSSGAYITINLLMNSSSGWTNTNIKVYIK